MRLITVAAALLLSTLFARPALARPYQIETGVFIGAHIYSETNGLGRFKNQTPDNSFSPGMPGSGMSGSRSRWPIRRSRSTPTSSR